MKKIDDWDRHPARKFKEPEIEVVHPKFSEVRETIEAAEEKQSPIEVVEGSNSNSASKRKRLLASQKEAFGGRRAPAWREGAAGQSWKKGVVGEVAQAEAPVRCRLEDFVSSEASELVGAEVSRLDDGLSDSALLSSVAGLSSSIPRGLELEENCGTSVLLRSGARDLSKISAFAPNSGLEGAEGAVWLKPGAPPGGSDDQADFSERASGIWSWVEENESSVRSDLASVMGKDSELSLPAEADGRAALSLTRQHSQKSSQKLLEILDPDQSDAQILAAVMEPELCPREAVLLARELLEVSGGLEALARSPRFFLESQCFSPRATEAVAKALLLGSRIAASFPPRLPMSRKILLRMFRPQLSQLSHEEVHLVLLDHLRRFRGKRLLARGGVSSCSLYVRDVLGPVLEARCPAFALVHNHPSDAAARSHSDRMFTDRVDRASKVVGLVLIDHLIIGPESVVSSMPVPRWFKPQNENKGGSHVESFS